MFHHILWDVRENPNKAQYVKKLSTGLSLETLNEFATTPALPSLKIVCEFPMPWECIAEKKRFGSSEDQKYCPRVSSRHFSRLSCLWLFIFGIASSNKV